MTIDHSKEIIVKDYHSGIVFVYKDISEVVSNTGVRFADIYNRAIANSGEEAKEMLAGYDFIFVRDYDGNIEDIVWQDFTEEEAEKSRHEYFEEQRGALC